MLIAAGISYATGLQVRQLPDRAPTRPQDRPLLQSVQPALFGNAPGFDLLALGGRGGGQKTVGGLGGRVGRERNSDAVGTIHMDLTLIDVDFGRFVVGAVFHDILFLRDLNVRW